MNIANPIYDVVFKYLMEDKRVAKLIISSLTNLDVQELELRPTEYHREDPGKNNFTVYRMDFAAQVKTPSGTKLVLIEIQKAKFATDIMRFRRYLGSQYSNPDNCICVNKNGKQQKVGEPLFTIYFLGHYLEFGDTPVIKVKRSCIDASTNTVLCGQSDFIESLTHDSVVVQIPALKNKRRNKLEELLSVFDQDLTASDDKHSIQLSETEYPDEFKCIFRRLLKAGAEPEMRKNMNIEDEILEELEEKERMIADLGEQAEEAITAQAKAEAKTKEAKEQTKQAKEQTKQAEAKTKQAEVQAKQAENTNKQLVEMLRKAGVSEEDIQKQLK